MKKFKMPKLYANQWKSLWEEATVLEKMQRDGEIGSLMTGGAITHINIDSGVTASQSRILIKRAIKEKMAHFALNRVSIECRDCGTVSHGNLDVCPKCNGVKLDKYTRVIGYFSKVNSWNKTRRELDFPKRTFTNGEIMMQELEN